MTLQEFSKSTGLSIKKIYNYSKYKGGYSSRIIRLSYKLLPYSMQLAIQQVRTNLIIIRNKKTSYTLCIGLRKSGFKVCSKDFKQNILMINNKDLDREERIEPYINMKHVELLISKVDDFIQVV